MGVWLKELTCENYVAPSSGLGPVPGPPTGTVIAEAARFGSGQLEGVQTAHSKCASSVSSGAIWRSGRRV